MPKLDYCLTEPKTRQGLLTGAELNEPNTLEKRLPKLLWFSYFSLLLCWALRAYFEIFIYLKKGILFARVMDGHPYTSDFLLWYNAALLAAACSNGKYINIYDPVIQNAGIVALAAPVVPELNFYTQYPPQFFTLVRPLAGLGLTNAWICWCVLSFILICWALLALSKDFGASKFSRGFVVLSVFASFPAWISFELGQTALYQFPASVAFWLLLRCRKFFLAGLISAILLVKLQYIPIIVATGLIVGRGKYLAGLSISGLVLAALTVATVGWSNVVNYPQALLYGETSSKVGGVSPFEMQNLRGELFIIQGGENHLVHLVSVACYGGVVLLLAALWILIFPRLKKAENENGGRSFEICASITILMMLIASPHTHTQEFLNAAVSCVFLFKALNLSEAKSAHLGILRNAIISLPILSWVFFIFRGLLRIVWIQPFFFWAVLVLTISIYELTVMLRQQLPKTATRR